MTVNLILPHREYLEKHGSMLEGLSLKVSRCRDPAAYLPLLAPYKQLMGKILLVQPLLLMFPLLLVQPLLLMFLLPSRG